MGLPNQDLSRLSREELEAEVRRLRSRTRSTSIDKARQSAVFDSALDFAMMECVDWFNNGRPLEPIGNIPSAEAEARYYAQAGEQALAA